MSRYRHILGEKPDIPLKWRLVIIVIGIALMLISMPVIDAVGIWGWCVFAVGMLAALLGAGMSLRGAMRPTAQGMRHPGDSLTGAKPARDVPVNPWD